MVEDVVKGAYFFWNFFKCLDFLNKGVLCFPLRNKEWHIQQGDLKEYVTRIAQQVDIKKEIILSKIPPSYSYINFEAYGNTLLPGKLGIALPSNIFDRKHELVRNFFITREILRIKSNEILFLHLLPLFGNFTSVYFLNSQFLLGSLFIGQTVHLVMQVILLKWCQNKRDIEALKYFSEEEKNQLLRYFFSIKSHFNIEAKAKQYFLKWVGSSVDERIKNIQASVN